MRVAAAEALLEACVSELEGLPAALEAAGRLLGFDYFCLVRADLDRPAFIASEGQREGIAAYFAGGWRAEDFRARTEQKWPINTLYLDHKAVGDDERRQSAIYNEFYRPNRMANYAGIRFDFGGEEWFCSASRAEEAGVIEGEDATNFVRIARTAMNAASLAIRLRDSRADGMLEGLHASGAAALLLDGDGRVIAVTPAAERVFGPDLGVRSGELWSANGDDMRTLGAIARSARGGTSPLIPRRVVLRGQGRRRPVLVNISAVLGSTLDALPGGRLLLVLSDMAADDVAIDLEIESLFGLTPAEAQIAAAIFGGAEAADIARSRGVAETTVRKQIASVFRKLDVNRQVDLVRLLASLRR